MRTFSPWLLATCLAVTITLPAVAQTDSKPLPAPQPFAGIPSRPLLLEPIIQQELGFTNKQRENLALIEAEAEDARQFGQADPGEEGFDFNAMMGGLEVTAKQQRAAIAKLLSSSQKARLLQIEMQREGWLSLGRPDVGVKLKLSPAQTQQIRSIIETMRQQQSQATFAAPDAVTEARKNAKLKPNLNPNNGFLDTPDELLPVGGPMNFSPDGLAAQANQNLQRAQKIQDSAANEVNKVLSPESRAAFERLLGPSFDFQRLAVSTTDPSPTPPIRANPRSKRAGKPR